MKVLVRFKGDNDFGTVMRVFGNLLLPRVQMEDALTPEQVAAWFNEVGPALYEIVQCAGQGGRLTTAALTKTRAYLHIEPADVYVGAGVDEKMKTAHSWANFDSVMVDGSECAHAPVYLV